MVHEKPTTKLIILELSDARDQPCLIAGGGVIASDSVYFVNTEIEEYSCSVVKSMSMADLKCTSIKSLKNAWPSRHCKKCFNPVQHALKSGLAFTLHSTDRGHVSSYTHLQLSSMQSNFSPQSA